MAAAVEPMPAPTLTVSRADASRAATEASSGEGAVGYLLGEEHQGMRCMAPC